MKRSLIIGTLCVSMLGLAGVSRAEKGGLPLCQTKVRECNNDLAACEAQAEVFPGDGVTGDSLSYTDNNDGTFTDNNTKLIWEKKTATGCSSTDIHCVDNVYTWSSTGTAADGTLFTAFITTLNTPPCFAGHCDWRLPNSKELQSILDFSKLDPASVPGATIGSNYWSSTSLASPATSAWVVNSFVGFGGGIYPRAKSASNFVRVVRNAQ